MTQRFQIQNTLKQLFSYIKNTVDKVEQANVIYKIRWKGNDTNMCDL